MQILRTFFPSGLLGHVGMFYLHRALSLCFPLLLLPLLAHRLTQDALGLFFVLQAWGLVLSYLIDYGFVAHGPRAIVRADSAATRSREISRIITAQLLLTAFITPAWLILYRFIPVLQSGVSSAVFALLLAATTVLTPNWYFMGRQKLSIFVIMDAASRLGVLLAILFLSYDQDDFTAPYIIITAGQMLTCVLSFLLLARHENLRLAPLSEARDALKQNWRLCLTEIGLAVSVSFNAILLSLFAPPVMIAAYGIAEKIIRGCSVFMIALSQALYPHFTRLQQQSALGLRKLLGWAISSNAVLTMGAWLGIWLFAPVILPWLAKADPMLALDLTYWQVPALFLFGLQGTVYMHGLLARHDDATALRATFAGMIVYAAAGTGAVIMQSVYAVIFAQVGSLLVMILASLFLQKKTPAIRGG